MLKKLFGPLILAALVIAACTPAGPAAIQITSVTPADDATDVAVTSPVTATFGTDLSVGTIARSFTLASEVGPVEGTTSYDPDTRVATFTPDANLAFGTEYTATVSTELRSEANGRLASDYVWSFTTVTEAADVTGVTVTPATAAILTGQTRQLTAEVAAAGGADESVTWSSSNTAVATVNANGLVTAVTAGSATITATSVFDTSVSGSSVMTVTDTPAVGSVVVTPATASLAVADTLQLNAAVDTVGGADDSVTWTSSDELVASVDEDGLVTAAGSGTATITATSVFDTDVSDSAAISVWAINSVTVAPATTDLAVGGTVTLTATVDSDGVADETVTWTSDDETVATVDAGGTVTAVGEGTATITATSVDPTVSGAAAVVVHPALTSADYVTEVGYLEGTAVAIAAPVVSGGLAPYAFELTAGALSAGLTLDIADGSIDGAATEVGLFAGTVTVTDALGQTAVSAFDFQIVETIDVVLYVGEDSEHGELFGPVAMVLTGGLAPFTFTVEHVNPDDPTWADRFEIGGPWSDHAEEDQGPLPAGLEVDATGAIVGTVDDYGFHRTYIRTTDAIGQTEVTQLEIDLGIGLLYASGSYDYPTGEDADVAPGTDVQVPGATPPFTFTWARTACSVDPCSDAAWTIDAATGAITRSELLVDNDEPEHNGNRTYEVTVTDAASRTATFEVSFVEVPVE